MTTENWVLDVTMWGDDELRAFCPLNDDGSILVGLTMITDRPPGPIVGVFHPAGQDAVDNWCEQHPEVIKELFGIDYEANGS